MDQGLIELFWIKEARVYLNRSSELQNGTDSILKDNLTEVRISTISKEWARQLGEGIEYTYSLLVAFQKGC
ncbi:hypothetical protein C9994_08945 [Marivirga lumbricoides]|uniref:Uncharacterized protein n=1 Tax=Marivirga lumbricoides TaxID=1046115 RepID=A0A2T4DQH1_9BACT|nr:hypothetical protein C9994_08945 [Marivirga lumbricoides]